MTNTQATTYDPFQVGRPDHSADGGHMAALFSSAAGALEHGVDPLAPDWLARHYVSPRERQCLADWLAVGARFALQLLGDEAAGVLERVDVDRAIAEWLDGLRRIAADRASSSHQPA